MSSQGIVRRPLSKKNLVPGVEAVTFVSKGKPSYLVDLKTRGYRADVLSLVTTQMAMILGKVPEECSEKVERAATHASERVRAPECIAMIGMAGFMVLGKPIMPKLENKEYISKRWEVGCAMGGIDQTKGTMSDDDYSSLIVVQTYFEANPEQKRVWISEMLEENNTRTPKFLKDQILLVWEYAGMKSLQIIKAYIASKPYSLLSEIILDQALAFNKEWKELEDKLGDDVMYARLMKWPEVEKLNHRLFPDLYYLAVTQARRAGALGKKEQYVMSTVSTKMPTSELRSRSRMRSMTSTEFVATETIKNKLREFEIELTEGTIKTMTRIGKERKRKRYESSDEEDEEETEERSKRGRQ